MKKKAQRLLERIRDLQWSIYCFADECKTKDDTALYDLLMDSGFELGVSEVKMEDVIRALTKKIKNKKPSGE